ncbi:MAG: hypothetical protein Q9198_000972 [Flavoplaca austrocitrina]
MPQADTDEAIVRSVNEGYGSVAINAPGAQGGATIYHNTAIAFGYTEADLQSVPDGANLGLSCGNPIALANLRQGEVVIDLGCGGGFDVFVAAQKIGENGRAIGVDMTDQMLELARRNAQKRGSTNVEFIKAAITSIPLKSNIADCIISNCVINLVPRSRKHLVFTEMFRLLRDGGRVAVSDLLARKELPDKIRQDVAAYVGCIAGAALVSEYEHWLREAGFDDIMIVDTKQDTNRYKNQKADMPNDATAAQGCCGSLPVSKSTSAGLQPCLADYDLNEWIGPFKIFAVKNGKR